MKVERLKMEKLKKIFILMICMFVCIEMFPLNLNVEAKQDSKVTSVNDSEFTYHGDAYEGSKGWGTDNNIKELFEGDSHWTYMSKAPNDESIYFEYTFVGTKVEIYGNKEQSFGKVKVYIDGKEAGIYDGYNPKKIYRQKLWESDELKDGQHTIKAVLLNQKNENSTGYNMLIDYVNIYSPVKTTNEYTLEEKKKFNLAFNINASDYTWESNNKNVASVENGIVTALKAGEATITATKKDDASIIAYKMNIIKPLNENLNDFIYDEISVNDSKVGTGDMQFNYHGSWGTDNGIAGLYGNDCHWSDESNWKGDPLNHYLTFKFTGSKISIYGSKKPKHGIYNVMIDDVLVGKIDAYAPEEKKQQIFFESPVLTNAEHELKVVMTGEKNKNASAASGTVDFVKVTQVNEKIFPKKISLENNATSYEKGFKFTPNVVFEPSDTNQKDVTFAVDDKMIHINKDGSLTPIKEGKTEISAIALGEDGKEIKSAPLTIEIKDGSKLGKLDYVDKNRRVEPEKYDDYGIRFDKEDTLTLWKNDCANSAAVLLTKDEDVKATITASNFTNQYGDVLDSSNVEANFQKYVSTYEGSNWIPTNPRPFDPPTPPEGHRKPIPDVIYGKKMDIPANTVQPIWINVNIPKDTKSGIYKGTITVDMGNGEKVILKQTVEVLEATLDDQDYYLNLWQYPYSASEYYNVEPFSKEHLAIMKNIMEPYVEAGGKTGTASIVDEPWYHQTYCDYPSMIKWKKNNGVWSFDYTDFDIWVDFLLNEVGVEYIECYSLVPWENIVRYYENGEWTEAKAKPGSSEWQALWKPFLTDFTKHVDEKGWFDNIIIAMDERPMDQMDAALDLIESIPNKNGHTLKVGGAVGSYNKNVWDRLFTVTPHIGNINNYNISLDTIRKVCDERREKGQVTSIYTMIGDYPGMFSMSDPSESAWTIWFAEYCHTDGFLRWAYNAWTKDPLNDNAHPYFESGDMFFVYPGDYAGEKTDVRLTPRFEMMEEAINDVRKLRQIAELSEDYATKVDNIRNSVKSYVGTGVNNGIGTAGFRSGTEETKKALAAEVDRLHNETIKLSKEYAGEKFVEADYSRVEAAISKAEALDRSKYTEASLKVLDDALASVEYGLSKDHQNKVDSYAMAIEQAIVNLKEKEEVVLVNKEKLYALLGTCENYRKNDYTLESWSIFKEVYEEAKGVYHDKNATQKEVDRIIKKLEEAIQGLVKVEESEKPSKPDKNESDNVNTGVNENIGLFIIMSVIAGVGTFMLINRKRV